MERKQPPPDDWKDPMTTIATEPFTEFTPEQQARLMATLVEAMCVPNIAEVRTESEFRGQVYTFLRARLGTDVDFRDMFRSPISRSFYYAPRKWTWIWEQAAQIRRGLVAGDQGPLENMKSALAGMQSAAQMMTEINDRGDAIMTGMAKIHADLEG